MGKQRDLEPKQLRFCQEYVKDLNGTQAAIRAGYSKKTANEQSSQLLAKLNIQEKVKELQSEIASKLSVTAEMIAEEYRKIAFANFGDFIDDGNELKDISKLGEDQTRVVESVQKTVTEFDGGTKTSTKIKLHSKIAGLEALAKHLGFFEKDNNQKGVQIRVDFED